MNVESTDFRPSWQRAWHGVGGIGTGEGLFHALLNRYAEPHRKYHTQQHLAECLDAFESVIDLPAHPAEVEAALWFHDAIYNVKRNDNEERSADWAKAALVSGGARADAAELVRTSTPRSSSGRAPTWSRQLPCTGRP